MFILTGGINIWELYVILILPNTFVSFLIFISNNINNDCLKMSKYLKLFATTAEYEAYINGSDVVLANVSVAKDAPTTLYYSPWVEPPFFVKLTLNNGEVVELQGSGKLTELMVSNRYKSILVSAEIGELCTSIGADAFNNCTGLTSVTIPDSVTSIGNYAFGGCSSLTSIDIPSGVTSIGEGAFYRCGLTNVTIPSSVTSIGNVVFGDCSSLTSIDIPSSVTSIGKYAFRDCTGLTSITCNATTAPTIQSQTFQNVKTGGTLYVPNGSTCYDTWMGTGDYYLGKYNWTKVEQ